MTSIATREAGEGNPMRDELLALAARVEALAGADREVDAEITQHVMAALGCDLRHMKPSAYLVEFPNLCLEFSASLDAAMTLVPEGWFIDKWGEPVFRERTYITVTRQPTGYGYVEASAATPALALTAASLRARAAS